MPRYMREPRKKLWLISVLFLTTMLLSSVVGSSLLDGLAAWYSFDDFEGLTLVDSHNGINGTANNTRVFDANGVVGKAIDFTQGNDGVTFNNTFGVEGQSDFPITVAYWFKAEETTGNSDYVLQIGNQSETYHKGITFGRQFGNIFVMMYGDRTASSSIARRSFITPEFPENQWYHVVSILRGPTDGNIYVDGINQALTYSGSGGDVYIDSNYSTIGVWRGTSNNTYYSNNYSDEIAIWNRALTESEIQELYNSGAGLTYNQLTTKYVETCGYDFNTNATYVISNDLSCDYLGYLNANNVVIDFNYYNVDLNYLFDGDPALTDEVTIINANYLTFNNEKTIDINNLIIQDSTFYEYYINRATLNDVILQFSDINNSSMNIANATDVNIYRNTISNSILYRANIYDSNIDNSIIYDSMITNVSLTDVNIYNTVWDGHNYISYENGEGVIGVSSCGYNYDVNQTYLILNNLTCNTFGYVGVAATNIDINFNNLEVFVETFLIDHNADNTTVNIFNVDNLYTYKHASLVKLDNPQSLEGTGRAVAWNGNYLAVAHDSGNYLSWYYLDDENLIKLDDPAPLDGSGFSLSWYGDYLAVGHFAGNRISLYKKNGSSLDKIDISATGLSGTVFSLAWYGNYLATVHGGSPYITLFQLQGDNLVKLSGSDPLPGIGWAIAWNEGYLAVGHSDGNYLSLYELQGDALKLVNDDYNVGGVVRGLVWKDNYLVATFSGDQGIAFFELQDGNLIKLDDPDPLDPSEEDPFYANGRSPSWYGNYLVVLQDQANYIAWYYLDGNALNRLDDPPPLGGTGFGAAWNGVYPVFAHAGGNYLSLYKLEINSTKKLDFNGVNIYNSNLISYNIENMVIYDSILEDITLSNTAVFNSTFINNFLPAVTNLTKSRDRFIFDVNIQTYNSSDVNWNHLYYAYTNNDENKDIDVDFTSYSNYDSFNIDLNIVADKDSTYLLYYTLDDHNNTYDPFYELGYAIYFKFFDEDTGAELVPNSVVFNGIDYSSSVDTNAELILDISNLAEGNYELVVSNTSYSERTFILTIDANTNYEYDIGLVLNEDTINVDFQFYNEDQETLYSENYIQLYNDAENLLVYAGFLDDTGQTNINLKVNNTDYNFWIYEDNNTITYYGTIPVTINIPKDELTNTNISPFNVTITGNSSELYLDQVAGINTYFLSNTLSYYEVKIIDSNSEYFPRTYNVKLEGNPDSYVLQPYLIPIGNAYSAYFQVFDRSTNQPIKGVLLAMYKQVGGKKVLVEVKATDSTGTAPFSLSALDNYEVYFYYNNKLITDVEMNPAIITATTTQYYVYLTVDDPVSYIEDIKYYQISIAGWKGYVEKQQDLNYYNIPIAAYGYDEDQFNSGDILININVNHDGVEIFNQDYNATYYHSRGRIGFDENIQISEALINNNYNYGKFCVTMYFESEIVKMSCGNVIFYDFTKHRSPFNTLASYFNNRGEFEGEWADPETARTWKFVFVALVVAIATIGVAAFSRDSLPIIIVGGLVLGLFLSIDFFTQAEHTFLLGIISILIMVSLLLTARRV